MIVIHVFAKYTRFIGYPLQNKNGNKLARKERMKQDQDIISQIGLQIQSSK